MKLAERSEAKSAKRSFASICLKSICLKRENDILNSQRAGLSFSVNGGREWREFVNSRSFLLVFISRESLDICGLIASQQRGHVKMLGTAINRRRNSEKCSERLAGLGMLNKLTPVKLAK